MLAPSQLQTVHGVLPSGAKQYVAFISHYKIEAATEARWLQEQLEASLGKPSFLDSDECVAGVEWGVGSLGTRRRD